MNIQKIINLRKYNFMHMQKFTLLQTVKFEKFTKVLRSYKHTEVSKHLRLLNPEVFSSSIFLNQNSKYSTQDEIKRLVYVSQSNDIYTNLALEDWIYKHVDCSKNHILMLWCNDPCVVIGKFQNPWLEANIPNLKNITESGVKFARRNSGGGTVYHDRGNLNLTFFTSKKYYNRRVNLEFIKNVLWDEFHMDVEINKREDLAIDDCKISGTASKLGRLASYHHCTLLINANKKNLSEALKKLDLEIKTNASQSVRSRIINLQEKNPNINVDNLLRAIGEHFFQKGHFLLTPAKKNKTYEKVFKNVQTNRDQDYTFDMIEPIERNFPGLEDIKKDLKSWDWIFGKTPKFTVLKHFNLSEEFLQKNEYSDQKLTLKVLVENGIIDDIEVNAPLSLVSGSFDVSVENLRTLKGQKFSEDILTLLKDWSF